MTIKHKVSTKFEKKIFDIHVEILNIVQKFNLTKNQKEVLSGLLQQYNLNSNLDEITNNDLLFSINTRRKLMENLNINNGTFNNIISQFRMITGSKGKIINGRTINKFYTIIPENTNYFVIQIDKYDTINNPQQHSNREEWSGNFSSEGHKEQSLDK